MIPIIKIKIKEILIEIHEVKDVENMLIIEGRINTISTSKIKKIIVIRKNCSEKGIREDDFWSNPHSNGDNFSRSKKDFFEKKSDISITIFEINIMIIIVHIMFLINY